MDQAATRRRRKRRWLTITNSPGCNSSICQAHNYYHHIDKAHEPPVREDLILGRTKRIKLARTQLATTRILLSTMTLVGLSLLNHCLAAPGTLSFVTRMTSAASTSSSAAPSAHSSASSGSPPSSHLVKSARLAAYSLSCPPEASIHPCTCTSNAQGLQIEPESEEEEIYEISQALTTPYAEPLVMTSTPAPSSVVASHFISTTTTEAPASSTATSLPTSTASAAPVTERLPSSTTGTMTQTPQATVAATTELATSTTPTPSTTISTTTTSPTTTTSLPSSTTTAAITVSTAATSANQMLETTAEPTTTTSTTTTTTTTTSQYSPSSALAEASTASLETSTTPSPTTTEATEAPVPKIAAEWRPATSETLLPYAAASSLSAAAPGVPDVGSSEAFKHAQADNQMTTLAPPETQPFPSAPPTPTAIPVSSLAATLIPTASPAMTSATESPRISAPTSSPLSREPATSELIFDLALMTTAQPSQAPTTAQSETSPTSAPAAMSTSESSTVAEALTTSFQPQSTVNTATGTAPTQAHVRERPESPAPPSLATASPWLSSPAAEITSASTAATTTTTAASTTASTTTASTTTSTTTTTTTTSPEPPTTEQTATTPASTSPPPVSPSSTTAALSLATQEAASTAAPSAPPPASTAAATPPPSPPLTYTPEAKPPKADMALDGQQAPPTGVRPQVSAGRSHGDQTNHRHAANSAASSRVGAGGTVANSAQGGPTTANRGPGERPPGAGRAMHGPRPSQHSNGGPASGEHGAANSGRHHQSSASQSDRQLLTPNSQRLRPAAHAAHSGANSSTTGANQSASSLSGAASPPNQPHQHHEGHRASAGRLSRSTRSAPIRGQQHRAAKSHRLTPNTLSGQRQQARANATVPTSTARSAGRNSTHEPEANPSSQRLPSARRLTRFLSHSGPLQQGNLLFEPFVGEQGEQKVDVTVVCRNIQNPQVLSAAIKGFRGHQISYFVIDSCKVPAFPNDLFHGVDVRWLEMTNSSVQFLDNFLHGAHHNSHANNNNHHHLGWHS